MLLNLLELLKAFLYILVELQGSGLFLAAAGQLPTDGFVEVAKACREAVGRLLTQIALGSFETPRHVSRGGAELLFERSSDRIDATGERFDRVRGGLANPHAYLHEQREHDNRENQVADQESHYYHHVTAPASSTPVILCSCGRGENNGGAGFPQAKRGRPQNG